MSTTEKQWIVKRVGEPEQATVHAFEVDDKSYLVIQGGAEGVPTYMVFEAEYGVGDDGDGESGPMPYQFVKEYRELERGIGGSPDPAETLERALENQRMEEVMHDDEEADLQRARGHHRRA